MDYFRGSKIEGSYIDFKSENRSRIKVQLKDVTG